MNPYSETTTTHAIGSMTAEGQRFRVLRPHAQGGLGAVFVALDGELNREVALKQILDHHADDPLSRHRFVIEAEITGGLEHPGIVPVYGLGSYQDGRPFYAMRFIKGNSLKESIERFHNNTELRTDQGRRSLELRKLLRRFTDVCNTIDYAHSRGVLHRDIKPGNVIVGKHGETLVVDWGLAKAKGRTEENKAPDEHTFWPFSSSGSSETLPGTALGTPAYMSPEQARGDLESLGPRSDVYSLGASLYCLLTGHPPIQGDNAGVILRNTQLGQFQPPRDLEPSVDCPLEAICLKAMALDPLNRFESARALADDIDRWLADEPVSAWREPVSRRTRRWARRHRTLLAASMVAIVATAVGLALVAAIQNRDLKRLDQANLSLRVANTETSLARDRAERRVGLALEALGSFTDTVDKNLDVKNLPENTPLREELLRGPLDFYKRLRDDLEESGDVRPESRAALADAYIRLGKLSADLGSQEDANTAFDQAEAILSALAENGEKTPRDSLAELLIRRGKLLRQNGRSDEALDDFRRAQEIREALRLENPDDLDQPIGLASVFQYLADLQIDAGEPIAALQFLDRSKKVAEEVLLIDPESNPAQLISGRAAQRSGAILSIMQGELPEAREAYEDAVAILKPLAEANPDDTVAPLALADSYAGLGRVVAELGDQEAALGFHRLRLAVVDSLAVTRPTSSLILRNHVTASRDLAQALGELGQYEEAKTILEQALPKAEAIVANNPTDGFALQTLANVHNAIGIQHFNAGQVADALASIEDNADVMQRVVELSPENLNIRRNLAGTRYNIGYLRRELGDNAGALAAYDESLEMRLALDREYPDDPRFAFDAAATLGNIANIYRVEGNLETSLDALYRAVDLFDRLAREYPENVSYVDYLARNQCNLASTLIELGELSLAGPLLEQATELLRPLVEAEPNVILFRQDLVLNLENRGKLALAEGRAEDAIELYRQAVEVDESIAQIQPDSTTVVDTLALNLDSLARSLLAAGQFEEALPSLDRAETILNQGLAQRPDDARIPSIFAQVLLRRAEALARLERLEEAADAWSRFELMVPKDSRIGLGPALLAAWSGDAENALNTLNSLPPLDQSDVATPALLFERARVAVLAALVSPNVDLAERSDECAVALLTRSAALGQFRLQRARADLKIQPEWARLHHREDFAPIRLDLAFPTNPFAQVR